MQDSEAATHELEASAKELTLHWVALAVVAELASGGADATLLDMLQQRRTLIQQAVRQAELSILQMGQVRQQAAELIGQISSILTVTLPAMEMAQSQKS
jgi:23S rRNA A1618 N6-methylase RlmF